MKQRKLVVAFSVLVIVTAGLSAQITATTEDGRKVQLYRDGTWVSIERQAPVYTDGFRDIPWGSSEALVRERCGTPEAAARGTSYSVQVLERSADAIFEFIDDELAY